MIITHAACDSHLEEKEDRVVSGLPGAHYSICCLGFLPY